MSDQVAVGDLLSERRGTGARKNSGKPQWWQIPWFALRRVEGLQYQVMDRTVGGVILQLGEWQRGDDVALDQAIVNLMYLLAGEHNQPVPIQREHLPWHALISTAGVLEFGAKKYPACAEDRAVDAFGRPTPLSAGNWAKGMPWSVCLACAMSHLTKRTTGELCDEESGVFHLAHAMCNLLFLAAYRDLYPEGDDRISQFKGVS